MAFKLECLNSKLVYLQTAFSMLLIIAKRGQCAHFRLLSSTAGTLD